MDCENEIVVPIASQAEAEAGIVNNKAMTPRTVKQAIDALGMSSDVIAAASGAGEIGFDQTASYATGTVGMRLLDYVDVTAPPFNALGNGSNEKAILKAAYDLAEAMQVPLYLGKDKTYHLGTMSGTVEEVVFAGKGPPKIHGENVKLTATNHAATPQPAYIFLWHAFQGKVIEGITVEATNPQYANVNGLIAFGVRASGIDAGGLVLRNCVARGVLTGFVGMRSGHAMDGRRIRGIHLDNFVVENCYYGVNTQNEGDAVAGRVTIVNPRRAYFCYGVSDHDIDVDVKLVPGGNTLGSTGCILVTRAVGDFDTGPMAVRATVSGDTSRYSTLISTGICMKNASTGGKIGPWSIRCDLDSVAQQNSSGQKRLELISYGHTEPLVPLSGAANEWVGGISVAGNFLDCSELSSDVAIRRDGTTAKQTTIIFDPSIRIRNWHQTLVDKDLVFRISANRELRVHRGAVNNLEMRFPLAMKGQIYQLRHRVYAWGDNGGAFGHSTYREDVIIGSVAAPGGEVNAPVKIPVIAPAGAGNQAGVTYGGGIGYANLTFAGANYASSNSFALVETTYGDQC